MILCTEYVYAALLTFGIYDLVQAQLSPFSPEVAGGDAEDVRAKA